MSIIYKDEEVQISVDEETLIRSIALIDSMNDFCKEQKEEGVKETVEALTCASEVMQAFWCEHFRNVEEHDGE